MQIIFVCSNDINILKGFLQPTMSSMKRFPCSIKIIQSPGKPFQYLNMFTNISISLETPPHFSFNLDDAHGYQNRVEFSRGPLNITESSEIMRINRQLLKEFHQIQLRDQRRHIRKLTEKQLGLLCVHSTL